MAGEELLWCNPEYSGRFISGGGYGREDILDAEKRLLRFAPCIRRLFPETARQEGLIESELRPVSRLKEELFGFFNTDRTVPPVPGEILVKTDNSLPVSGSIKARGGIHEVLKFAEDLALEKGLVSLDDDYSVFASDSFSDFFSGYGLAVGSTGNLGLSIGIMGRALGFRVTVHMSSDAREWKKKLLREKGADVVEYPGDYSLAVRKGREEALKDPRVHFVDDEKSADLFFGYAAAASRLVKQLNSRNTAVDSEHPLFVYLPCGVGGGPGGISFGLKSLFGENVHCFFAEPVSAPSVLLGLATGLGDKVSVEDFGLSGVTEADGLAVGRPSGFVCRTSGPMVSGVYTVDDELLFRLLAIARNSEGIMLEPSAAAGIAGPFRLTGTEEGRRYLLENRLENKLEKSSHIIWATGGGMVPGEIMGEYFERGSNWKNI